MLILELIIFIYKLLLILTNLTGNTNFEDTLEDLSAYIDELSS